MKCKVLFVHHQATKVTVPGGEIFARIEGHTARLPSLKLPFLPLQQLILGQEGQNETL